MSDGPGHVRFCPMHLGMELKQLGRPLQESYNFCLAAGSRELWWLCC
jgi:hypothetical protein